MELWARRSKMAAKRAWTRVWAGYSCLGEEEGVCGWKDKWRRATVGPRGRGRALYLVVPSSIVSRGFFFPKIIYIPKKSPSVFILFGLRLIWIFCKTKNMQQTGTGTGHWINMLVQENHINYCQKYVKVVQYWHGTIKNYRYDGDVATSPSLIPARPRVGKW